MAEPFAKPFEGFDKTRDKDKIKKAKQYKKKIIKLLTESIKTDPEDTSKIIGGKFYNMSQIAGALGVSRQLLSIYRLGKDPDIYRMLNQVRTAKKFHLLEKMEESNDSKDRTTLFRLLADREELERLNTKHEITGGISPDDPPVKVEQKHEVKHSFDDKVLKKMPDNLLNGLIEFMVGNVEKEEVADGSSTE